MSIESIASDLYNNLGSHFADEETKLKWIIGTIEEAYSKGKKDEEKRIEKWIIENPDSFCRNMNTKLFHKNYRFECTR